jgi:hypothetical protein
MDLCIMDLMAGVFFVGQGRRLVVALTGALASKVGKVVEPLEARVDLWDVIVLESADQRLRMCAKGISSDESASSARINTARIIPVKDICTSSSSTVRSRKGWFQKELGLWQM